MSELDDGSHFLEDDPHNLQQPAMGIGGLGALSADAFTMEMPPAQPPAPAPAPAPPPSDPFAGSADAFGMPPAAMAGMTLAR